MRILFAIKRDFASRSQLSTLGNQTPILRNILLATISR